MKPVIKYTIKKRWEIIHLMLIAFILLLVTSCISKSTLLQQVAQKTDPLSKTSELYNKPHIVLTVNDSLGKATEAPYVNKKSSYLIPLVIYWGWNQKFNVQLPQKYLINVFNSVLTSRDKEFEYEKFFGDKTLEIELTKLPEHFIYSLTGTYLFLPYIAGLGIYYSQEEIYPEKQEIVVKYRFFNKETTLKLGRKSLEMKFPKSDIFNPSSQNMLYYIDDYRKEFEYQAGRLIDLVVDDL